MIRCENCDWEGCPEELHCSDEDFSNKNKSAAEIKFNLCPDCGKADCFEDLEDEDYDGDDPRCDEEWAAKVRENWKRL